MRRLFCEMSTNSPIINEPTTSGTVIYTDSTSAISLATNIQVSERNQHIELKVHHIKDLIKRGTVKLSYIGTTDQPADILTKPLNAGQIEHISKLINM